MADIADHIHRKVRELANLPTLPGIIKRISQTTENRESSAADIAGIISSDQVLSAKVLRLVNSPVYGFPGRISSVTHATVLLGFNVIKGLVLGTAIFDAIGAHGRGLWEHSFGCAVLSRRLAKELGLADIEEVMVAGLLHDLGKVVLAHLRPADIERAIQTAEAEHCHIAPVESRIFGVDHAQVAGWISAEWHFPARLAEPLKHHHAPAQAKECYKVTALVHLADILARGMGYGFPGDRSMPPLDDVAFQSLALSFEQIDRALEHAEADYAVGADLFIPGE